MKRIELTQEQRYMVLQKLQNTIREDGDFDIDVEFGNGIIVSARGYIYHDGYREKDFLGSGCAWVDTSVSADVVINCYDGEGEEACDVGGEFANECYDLIYNAA